MTTVTTAKQEAMNVMVKVNAKDELVITVPLKDFKMSKMVNIDLSSYELTKNDNFLVGSTRGWEKVSKEDYEHIAFSFSATAKKKVVMEEKTRIETMANQRQVASEALAESKGAPAMDMQEYQEFLEFKKWKAMMNQAK